MVSGLNALIPACKTAGEKYQKPIYLELPEGDRVINDLAEQINGDDAGKWVKLIIY